MAGKGGARWCLGGPEGRQVPFPYSGSVAQLCWITSYPCAAPGSPHRQGRAGQAVACPPHPRAPPGGRVRLCRARLTPGHRWAGQSVLCPPHPWAPPCGRVTLCCAPLAPSHRRAGGTGYGGLCPLSRPGHSADPPRARQARSCRPSAHGRPGPREVLTGRGQRRAGSPHPAGRGDPAQGPGCARADPRPFPGALRGARPAERTAPRPLNPRARRAQPGERHGRGPALPLERPPAPLQPKRAFFARLFLLKVSLLTENSVR